MTDIQERLLLLMDEIKDICQKENLHYVLANKTAYVAYKYGEFIDSTLSEKIFMPLSDIYKFKAYVEKNCSENRVIECWDNNSDLKRMKFRYVDKGTLLFNGKNLEHIKYPGISVAILPIREKAVSHKVIGCEHYVQAVNNDTKIGLAKFLAKKVFLKVFGYSFMAKLFHIKKMKSHNNYGLHWGIIKSYTKSKEEIISWVEDRVMLKDGEKPSYYWYLNPKGRSFEMPMDLFTNTKEAKLEGHSYNIYGDCESLFLTVYGEKWQDKYNDDDTDEADSDRITVIAECDLPYEEYLKYIEGKGPTLNEIADNKKNYNTFMSKYYNPKERRVMKKYYEVKRSVERIDVWSRLKPKREALKVAYNEKNVPELQKLLKEYLTKTDFYFKKGIAFYIDDEILNCAKLVWESENRPTYKIGDVEDASFADKIYSLVPDLYKTETVDQYFASRKG
jgi:hypothetical protein